MVTFITFAVTLTVACVLQYLSGTYRGVRNRWWYNMGTIAMIGGIVLGTFFFYRLITIGDPDPRWLNAGIVFLFAMAIGMRIILPRGLPNHYTK